MGARDEERRCWRSVCLDVCLVLVARRLISEMGDTDQIYVFYPNDILIKTFNRAFSLILS
jgi:hypothetical protein